MATELLARRFRSLSPGATEALGELVGRAVPAGTVLALHGDLGTGKTCFVRGLARGLGIADGVASPSYTLMQAHEGGRLPLYHFDAWMEGREKALFLDGGDDWLHGEGVSAVEWAGRVGEWMPAPRLELELAHAGPRERTLRLGAVGPDSGIGPHLRRLIADLELPEGIQELVLTNPETG